VTAPSPARPPRRWWILAVLCASLFIATLDNSVLDVAISHLVRDLGLSAGQTRAAFDVALTRGLLVGAVCALAGAAIGWRALRTPKAPLAGVRAGEPAPSAAGVGVG
jgi:hypothetical protein